MKVLLCLVMVVVSTNATLLHLLGGSLLNSAAGGGGGGGGGGGQYGGGNVGQGGGGYGNANNEIRHVRILTPIPVVHVQPGGGGGFARGGNFGARGVNFNTRGVGGGGGGGGFGNGGGGSFGNGGGSFSNGGGSFGNGGGRFGNDGLGPAFRGGARNANGNKIIVVKLIHENGGSGNSISDIASSAINNGGHAQPEQVVRLIHENAEPNHSAIAATHAVNFNHAQEERVVRLIHENVPAPAISSHSHDASSSSIADTYHGNIAPSHSGISATHVGNFNHAQKEHVVRLIHENAPAPVFSSHSHGAASSSIAGSYHGAHNGGQQDANHGGQQEERVLRIIHEHALAPAPAPLQTPVHISAPHIHHHSDESIQSDGPISYGHHSDESIQSSGPTSYGHHSNAGEEEVVRIIHEEDQSHTNSFSPQFSKITDLLPPLPPSTQIVEPQHSYLPPHQHHHHGHDHY